MVNPEQVLHVAKLARLKLNDTEVTQIASELSGILEHVEKLAELELGDVAPTTHVVDIDGALRPDEPRPSLAKDVVLAAAPATTGDGFLVPSPSAEAA